ncbi:MAG: M20/M25/M40 family metallo-hydrolase [Acidobacteria bacterium]|nr:M20/M25/M40 family metallo-hydrolase [Acidobacteriota bacterium]
MMPCRDAAPLLAMLCLSAAAGAQNTSSTLDTEHRAILRELVEINTSTEGGSVAPAARAVAARLAAAGYGGTDLETIGPNASCVNVLATLRGKDTAARPVLLMAHLDVVPAKREDWAFDPYVLREEKGWFLGRGVLDNKAGASVLVANMIRWKREGFVPSRDIVMVLTCDEETSAEAGMRWLLTNRPRLAQAEYALNTDAGGVERRASGRVAFYVQAAEKSYVTFALTAKNEGGHSSVPRPDNAIYALATALGRLAAFRFPVQYNPVSQASFARVAALESGQLAEDLAAAGRGETSGPAIDRLAAVPHVNSDLRTTCVATMLSAGHAENALPQSATATVNCRVMPGTPEDEVKRTLEKVVADPTIAVSTVYPMVPSTASPLRDDVLPAVEKAADAFWPGAHVVPGMSAGATDGLYLRNVNVPVFGLSAIEIDPAEDRSHGLDERAPVRSVFESREYWYGLVKALLGR